MFGFGEMIKGLKANPKSIVFTEGTDARILEASARLLSGTFLKPILIGKEDEVFAAAEEAGFNIRGAEIVDPASYPKMDEMVKKMVELRKGKMSEEQCREALTHANYFGTMLVAMGEADCLLGGATYSTADTVRPALQLVKTKPGNKIVSSCFIMVRERATGENEVLAMADCAINIDPTEDDLVEIATETVKCGRVFGIDPRVAFLSYSTKGSGKGETVDKMRNACAKTQAAMPDVPVDGEMQFDAATSRSSRAPSTSTAASAVRRTCSSSPTSTPATSATRSPSASAASTPTARSCSASTRRSTTSPAAATARRSTPWRSSPPPLRNRKSASAFSREFRCASRTPLAHGRSAQREKSDARVVRFFDSILLPPAGGKSEGRPPSELPLFFACNRANL